MRRADDRKAQLRAPSLQKGELLELLSVLPLKHLPHPTLLRKLILKEHDFSREAIGVSTSRREHCGILHLHSGHAL
jgi:hypothetical protein